MNLEAEKDGDSQATDEKASEEASKESSEETSSDEKAEEDASEEEEDEGKGKKKKKKKEKKGEDGEKGGFFSKLKAMLFGPDDDEDDKVDLNASNDANAEGLSAENAAILAELGMTGDEGADKKGKKKKEKKKKEKKEKKPKKEKPPKEKKPKKPKKEKKPKEVDKTPPLPKGPVIVIWIMALSLIVFIYLGTTLLRGQMLVKAGKKAYTDKDYTKAYQSLTGLKLNEEDQKLYVKTEVLGSVEGRYEAYKTLYDNHKYAMALDALVCGKGRCQNYEETAKKYKCTDELKELEHKAKQWYNMGDWDQYSLEIYKRVKELGLLEES